MEIGKWQQVIMKVIFQEQYTKTRKQIYHQVYKIYHKTIKIQLKNLKVKKQYKNGKKEENLIL